MPYQIIRRWRVQAATITYGGAIIASGWSQDFWSTSAPSFGQGRFSGAQVFAMWLATSFGNIFVTWGQHSTPDNQYSWSGFSATDITPPSYDLLNGTCTLGNSEFMPNAHANSNCNTGLLGYNCNNGNCNAAYSGTPFYRVSQYGSAAAALAACRNGCKANCGQCPPGHVCFTDDEAEQLFQLLKKANIEFKA